jgi:signal peptidase I
LIAWGELSVAIPGIWYIFSAMTAPNFPPLSTGSPDRARNRRLVAGFLSVVLPGSGQLITGRRRAGLIFLAIFCALIGIYLLLRLPAMPGGIFVLPTALFILSIWATVDAAYMDTKTWDKPSQWWLGLLLPACLLGVTIHANWPGYLSGFRLYSLASGSMEPTLHKDDRVVVDTRYYKQHPLRHGDVVMFASPSQAEIALVKRAIGLAGDTVVGEDGRVRLNGVELQESYVQMEGSPVKEADNFGPFTVPAGKAFFLGDNRRLSLDSRYKKVGFVDLGAIRGRVLYTVPSFNHGEIKVLKVADGH